MFCCFADITVGSLIVWIHSSAPRTRGDHQVRRGILKGFAKAGISAAVAAAILSSAGTAQAQHPDLGAGAPGAQIGVQLYDWSNYLSNGAGEITCPASPAPATPNCVAPPAPTTSATRLARVFAFLQSK